jgi:acetyl esterase/lipase
MPFQRNLLCRSFLWLTLSIVPFSHLAAAEPKEILLWPNGLPAGAKSLTADQIAKLKAAPVDPERINLVENPSMILYQASAELANGCGIIVCPGGAYTRLAWEKEGIEVAQWLNSLGVTVGVLKYRVPRRDPDEPHREPLQDAQRAIRIMRANATQWGVDSKRVGVLGFSAGGHLAVMTGVHGPNATYPSSDAIDQQDCQPQFLCPIYAAYLGEKYNDRDTVPLGESIKITSKTPPTFMAVTADDAYRGVQAASMFIALKQANVPAELHIYSRGGHGYGIRSTEGPIATWHLRLADWLRDSGYLTK